MIDEKCSRTNPPDYRSSPIGPDEHTRRGPIFAWPVQQPLCTGLRWDGRHHLADLLSSFHRLLSLHLLSQPLTRAEGGTLAV